MEPIKVDFTGGSGKGSGKGKDAYLVPEKSIVKLIIRLVGTVVGALVAYYFMLPPMNFKSLDMYIYFAVVLGIYIGLTFLMSPKPEYTGYVKKQSIPAIVIAAVLAVVVLIGFLVSSVFFRAASYHKIIAVDDQKTFSSDISEADFTSIPVLDDASSAVLANRALGDLASINKVSQFEVSSEFTQINYKNEPVRVTTLSYGDIFKWIKNTSTGFPGYIVVNMVSQKTDLVLLPEGQYIRYSPNEHFGKYLMRHVRFNYPTYLFDEPHFEIDEQGQPFWLCPVLDKTIGLFGGTDVKGVVIVSAITGECNEYSIEQVKTEKELQWIDSIYSSSLLVEQYNYYGKYGSGFINSVLGQEGVKVATEGSNFLAKDDDVYMYTGVTSAGGDQAIIGFVLINMRTKAANFYSVSGAKETSAMESAQGEVQDYKFTASFPILINISGQPTYFMALKDSGNLVKRYAMVNVQHYQVIVTGDTIAKCTEAYAQKLKENNINIKVDIDRIENETQNTGEDGPETPAKPETEKLKGKIADIRTAVMGGESVYFIKLENSKVYFRIKASDALNVVILNVGDTVTVEYDKAASGDVIDAISVK